MVLTSAFLFLLAAFLTAGQARIKKAENLLYINASACSISATTTNATLPSEIVAAFNSNWRLLSSQISQAEEMKGLVIQKWLPLLFSFVTIHASVYSMPPSWPREQSTNPARFGRHSP
jgi:hypothetical protein